MCSFLLFFAASLFPFSAHAISLDAKTTPRARASDLGIRIGRSERGRLNAITDVAGVGVGHTTVSSGDGPLIPGKGPVRTGVTVILPTRDSVWKRKVPAGVFVLNGNGEATGISWVEESGWLETPIALTNTHAVGTVQRALIDWLQARDPKIGISDDTALPVVFECDDSSLNDIRGDHVKAEQVQHAIQSATFGGSIEEGSVGAGTGMMSYEFKGGIGTASRVLEIGGKKYTLGVLLNTNHGDRHTLRIAGVPVGEKITDLLPQLKQDGSVVLIVATDAPLDARQLKRLSKRVMLGIARTGAVAKHSSGDFALSFSTATANRIPHPGAGTSPLLRFELLADWALSPLFEAATDAAEEAILNALFAARTVTGRDGNTAYEIPLDRVRALLPAAP